MAHEGLWASSSDILLKAGADYASTFTEAQINTACLRAESEVNDITRHNWSDEFTAAQTTTMNADFWYILAELEAVMVAAEIVAYSMATESAGVRAAEKRLDYLKHRRDVLMEVLKDKTGVQTFMGVI